MDRGSAHLLCHRDDIVSPNPPPRHTQQTGRVSQPSSLFKVANPSKGQDERRAGGERWRTGCELTAATHEHGDCRSGRLFGFPPALKSTFDVCIIFVAERGYPEWSIILHLSTSSIVKSRSENKNIVNILVDGAPPEFTFAF